LTTPPHLLLRLIIMRDNPPCGFCSDGRRAALPAPRNGEPFIKGPLHWSFWSRVGRTSPQALRLAMAVKYWSGFRRGRGVTRGVRLGLADMGALGLNPRSARRALYSLESLGLVTVERGASRKPVVTLEDRPGCGLDRARSLYLPVPWAWWYRACQGTGGAAVQVALALWFRAGWLGGRARFPFGSCDWESLGCSRWTASRGLHTLEQQGLVAVERNQGRAPVVTIRPDCVT
jgi:hypothetical protein